MHHLKNTLLRGYWIASVIVLSMFLPVDIEAGIYKWRDENGKLHFSSVPPKSSKSIQPDTSPLETPFKPTLSQGRVYCGTKAGPRVSSNTLEYLISIQRLLRSKKIATNFGQYSTSGEDRCLVNWANKELEAYSKQMARFEKKYQQALHKLNSAVTHKANKCPQARGMMIGKEAQDWAFCQNTQDTKITQAKQVIRQLKPLFE